MKKNSSNFFSVIHTNTNRYKFFELHWWKSTRWKMFFFCYFFDFPLFPYRLWSRFCLCLCSFGSLSFSLSLSKNKRIILNWVSPASQGFFIEMIAYQNTVDRLVVCNLYSIQSYLKHLARSRLFISIYAAFELKNGQSIVVSQVIIVDSVVEWFCSR